MMSNQHITTGTLLYAIFGFFMGLILAWFIGWASVPWLRTMAATGWVFVIWGGFVLIFGMWIASLIPAMKTGMKAMPLAAFLGSMELGLLLVLITALFQGLNAFGF
jgi:FtsH-binding integral membrane protein